MEPVTDAACPLSPLAIEIIFLPAGKWCLQWSVIHSHNKDAAHVKNPGPRRRKGQLSVISYNLEINREEKNPPFTVPLLAALLLL